MAWDPTIRVTDLAIIGATLLGPVLAVQALIVQAEGAFAPRPGRADWGARSLSSRRLEGLMTAESERLAGLYRGWTDEMLVVAATRERGDYEPDALAAIQRELGARGITPDGEREEGHQIDDAQLAHERAAYSRMGGWLFFFALNLAAGVLAGLTGLIRLSMPYQSAAVGAIYALEAALGAYAGMVLVLFVRHRRSGPFHASAWVCLTWLLTLGASLVMSPMLLVLSLRTAQAAGWVLYFQRSRRVAVYFAVPAPRPG